MRQGVLAMCALWLFGCAQVLGIEEGHGEPEGAGGQGGVGASGSDPCGSVSILSDDFDGATIAPSWTVFGATETVTQADGAVVLQTAPGANEQEALLVSSLFYRFRDTELVVELDKVTLGSDGVAFVGLLGPSLEGAASFEFFGDAVVLRANALTASFPFDINERRFLRIRERGGTMEWSSSPDGAVWSDPLLIAATQDVFPDNFVFLNMFVQGTAGLSELRVATVNHPEAPAPRFCPVGDLRDDFDAATRAATWSRSDLEGTCVATQGGKLVLSGGLAAECRYGSSTAYDLTDASITLELDGMAVSGASRGAMNIAFGDARFLTMGVSNGNLFSDLDNGATGSANDYMPYDPNAHRWLRVTQSSSNHLLKHEISPDGRTWTPWTTFTLQDDTDVARCAVNLLLSVDALPASVTFDNLNRP